MNQESKVIQLKWKEVYSLSALSAAIAISWIAYHEYQPLLISEFGLSELYGFLIVAKGIIVVSIPPVAGWITDYMMRLGKKSFIVFSIGVGLTAMIFMAVASLLGAGPESPVSNLLPYLVILWLVGMNVFNSPALSMIESFAPSRKLPIVVGVIFFVIQLVYALEPLIVQIILFIGETLTFVLGGILIAGTGWWFQRVSSDEIRERKGRDMTSIKSKGNIRDLVIIIFVGLAVGIGYGFLLEYTPYKLSGIMNSEDASLFSFSFLALAAVIALLSGRYTSKVGPKAILIPSVVFLVITAVLSLYLSNFYALIITFGAMALFTGFASVSGLPYAIGRLSPRYLTFGVGVFIGSSNIVEGFLEYYLLT